MDTGTALNVADTPRYAAWRKAHDGVFVPACRSGGPEELTALADGFSVRTRHYEKQMEGAFCRASESDLLDKEGRVRYTWRNLDGDGEFATLLRHADGRRYLVFRRELYGYSVLDPDALEAFHFVPGECFPEEGAPFQESFIWTGVDYAPGSNLLAASGCYWGCPSGVVLLEFARPMAEHPWLDLHPVLDPEWELYDDIEFDRWDENGGLFVRAFSVQAKGYEAVHLGPDAVRRALDRAAPDRQ